MHDIEAIERATFAAVPPRAQEEWDGWLLGLDDGTVGRCHSAVPLNHAAPGDDALHAIEARYAAAGLPPVFRIPEVPAFDALRAQLRAAGYAGTKPTLVQLARLTEAEEVAGVELAASPDAGWEQVFLGEGFDPVDGRSRLAVLRRSRSAVFASIREGARTVACGSACFSHDWCGVHGMRTAPDRRGRGLANQVLQALARAAQARGVTRAFLQVDQANATAQALYRRRGFATAWAYAYWQR
jgi:ribosomal protein S18 acetylase RimI-like enzyme